MPRANILSSGKMLLLHRKKFRCNNNFLCGFEEVQPGVYDLRNWGEMRNWAWQLAKIATQ